METQVLLNALDNAIEAEENIALKMLMVYSKESINRMSTDLKETADVLSKTTNFHTLANILRLSAKGE
jgi:hypothetical protein